MYPLALRSRTQYSHAGRSSHLSRHSSLFATGAFIKSVPLLIRNERMIAVADFARILFAQLTPRGCTCSNALLET